MTSKKTVKLICKTGSEEIMIHYQNGKIEFHSWWPALKLVWLLMRNDVEIEVVDGDKP